jgi:predicted outer membrane protein
MKRRDFLAGLMVATAPLALTRTAVAQAPAPGGAMPTPIYVSMLSRGGQFLEESSRVAFDKTDMPAVRRFARAEVVEQVQLAGDLSANANLATAAVPGGAMGMGMMPGGMTMGGRPMTTDAQRAAMLAQMQSLQGPQFDAAYVRAQIMGHEEALALNSSYSASGGDPALRRIAGRAAGLNRLHLSQLARIERGMGGASS